LAVLRIAWNAKAKMSRKSTLSLDPARLMACAEALADFGRYALQSSNLDGIFQAACKQVCSALDIPIAKIATKIPDSDKMLLAAAVGLPETAGAPGVTLIPGGAESAMGYTFTVRRPVLSTVDTETRFKPSEIIQKSGVRSSVNVVIWVDDQPHGILEADALEPNVFSDQDVAFLELYANLIGAAVKRRELSARTDNLTRELELSAKEAVHRIKNILSLVQAIAWRTKREASSLDDFMQLFQGRIATLAAIQDALLANNEQSLIDLIRHTINTCGAKEGEQFILEGPDFRCSEDVGKALGLFIHELTTNSCKYGALKPEAASGSRIHVCWHMVSNRKVSELEIFWKESVQLSESPTGNGFGSELLNAIPKMLGGTLNMSSDETGLEFVLRFAPTCLKKRGADP
jgi:two-component sensor histidine kinase